MKSHTNEEIAAIRNPVTYKEAQAEQDATKYTQQENGNWLEDKTDTGPLSTHFKLDKHADCKITELKEQNAASGWVDGLPPIGVEIEFQWLDRDYSGRTTSIIAIDGCDFWARLNENDQSNIYSLSLFKFRPILTHKERTIEAAIDVIGISDPENEVVTAMVALYDAGMLTLPAEDKPATPLIPGMEY